MKFVNLVDCDCRGKEFNGFIIKKYIIVLAVAVILQ